MNPVALNNSNNTNLNFQQQGQVRRAKRYQNSEVISHLSNSALINEKEIARKKYTKNNHWQPDQNAYGRRQKAADKKARKLYKEQLATANQEIDRLTLQLNKCSSQAEKSQSPTTIDLCKSLKKSNEVNSILHLFRDAILNLENHGHEIYKSLFDLTIKLEDTQENLAKYDSEYEKITETFKSVHAQSNEAILAMKEVITKADEFAIIPENMLASISAQQLISEEKIRTNEKTYADALSRCKQDLQWLTENLQDAEKTIDLVTVLKKSNQITLELDLLKTNINQLKSESAETVVSSMNKETTQESVEQCLIKQDEQYTALITEYQKMCPNFDAALKGLNDEKLSLLNSEFKNVKESLHQIKENLNKVDHQNVLLKNPTSWNLQFGGLRTFGEYTRLSPLDKGFTLQSKPVQKI